MKRFAVCFIALAFLLACGKNKKKMSGQEAVEISDFIEFFDKVSLPLTITDTLLGKKETDSTLISDTIFNQFVGDTIFQTLYGKRKPKIYALGRFRNGDDAETYLLIKTRGNVNAVYALAFTPENKYSANMVLLADNKENKEVNRVVVDTKYTFNIVDQYKDPDGSTNEFSQVYAYNNAGLFMMILQDGLPKGELMPILNPIDTLPMVNKYSGDYGKDSRNFISIRDGKTPKEFLFFINLDKGQNSNCQAELKGEAVFVTKDSAFYSTKTDPCVIGFKFGTKNVKISEAVICGNKRPADCSFNANYQKKKPAVAEKKPTDTKIKKKP
jgi:hypothetical protein